MSNMIQRTRARMAAYRDEIESRIDKLSSAEPQISTLADVAHEATLCNLMLCAMADDIAGTGVLLRALREPVRPKRSIGSPFGKPVSADVLDAEWKEINSEEP
jgi:hypothetical protein